MTEAVEEIFLTGTQYCFRQRPENSLPHWHEVSHINLDRGNSSMEQGSSCTGDKINEDVQSFFRGNESSPIFNATQCSHM